MNANTFEELAAHFQERLDNIRTILDLRPPHEPGSSIPNHIRNVEEEVEHLELAISCMKIKRDKQLEKLKHYQNLREKLDFVVKDLAFAVLNVPERLPKPQNAPVQANCASARTTNQGSQQPASSASHPMKENIPPKDSGRSKPKSNKPSYIPSVEYLTVDEFEAVPKYIKGRLNYHQINSIVDELNKAFKEKYKLMAMKRSTMNDVNRKRCENYKQQENKETKGEHFIVDDDIKEFGSVKLDSTFRSILTCLRHCGRLREARGGGHTRYVCLVVY